MGTQGGGWGHRYLTHGEVGGVDAVALRFVEHQGGRTAAVVRAHRVDAGSAHTALLLALVIVCGEQETLWSR